MSIRMMIGHWLGDRGFELEVSHMYYDRGSLSIWFGRHGRDESGITICRADRGYFVSYNDPGFFKKLDLFIGRAIREVEVRLIFCTNCQDIYKLDRDIRRCKCGKTEGQSDGLNATYKGANAIPLGFENREFVDAIQDQPREGLGKTFEEP